MSKHRPATTKRWRWPSGRVDAPTRLMLWLTPGERRRYHVRQRFFVQHCIRSRRKGGVR
jgi:hypothetical protein